MKKFFVGAALIFSYGLNAQWDTLNTGTGIRFNAIAADETMGLVTVGIMQTDSGEFGAKYVSGDNGTTWFPLPSYYLEENIELWDADFTPNGRVWIVGDSGRVALQTLAFLTFDCDTRISDYSLHTGYPINDSAFYCGGENGVLYRTFDRGLTWDTLVSGTGETINDIYFTDAANGWIVADGGYIAATSDSGTTWQFVSSGLFGFYDFNGFAYQDTTGFNPYIVGSSGTGLFSVNGGATWVPFATGTGAELNKIRFMNMNSGIICGNDAFISRSTDGGGTWFNDPCPETQADLFGIAFLNDTMAFICGDSGVVLRSRNDISRIDDRGAAPISGILYPNPAITYTYVQLYLSRQSDISIETIDATGRTVASDYYESVNPGENRFELNTGNLQSGFYFVRVVSGESVLTLPLLKQ